MSCRAGSSSTGSFNRPDCSTPVARPDAIKETTFFPQRNEFQTTNDAIAEANTPFVANHGPAMHRAASCFSSDVNRLKNEISSARRGSGKKVQENKASSSKHAVGYASPVNEVSTPDDEILHRQSIYIWIDYNNDIKPLDVGRYDTMGPSWVQLFRRGTRVGLTDQWLRESLYEHPSWNRQTKWMFRANDNNNPKNPITFFPYLAKLKGAQKVPSFFEYPRFGTTEKDLADAIRAVGGAKANICVVIPVEKILLKPKTSSLPAALNTHPNPETSSLRPALNTHLNAETSSSPTASKIHPGGSNITNSSVSTLEKGKTVLTREVSLEILSIASSSPPSSPLFAPETSNMSTAPGNDKPQEGHPAWLLAALEFAKNYQLAQKTTKNTQREAIESVGAHLVKREVELSPEEEVASVVQDTEEHQQDVDNEKRRWSVMEDLGAIFDFGEGSDTALNGEPVQPRRSDLTRKRRNPGFPC
ncbi:hypothetical protein ABW20_dc0101831 [Dactylellina cionopaga]|nr:hypothetical protein ABW20_dc0101831 [Dactylellina cionopaga]